MTEMDYFNDVWMADAAVQPLMLEMIICNMMIR